MKERINRTSAGQQMTVLPWNPKFLCTIHKDPTPVIGPGPGKYTRRLHTVIISSSYSSCGDPTTSLFPKNCFNTTLPHMTIAASNPGGRVF